MKLSEIIRKRRKARRLSQIELAVKSGVSLPTIQLLEGGRGNPTLEVLKKLERALGFTLEVSEEVPDWALLQKWILPVTLVEDQEISPEKPSPRKLLSQLWEAVEALGQIENERVAEGIAAALYALRRYYPLLFSYFSDGGMANRIFTQYSKGRMIKLSRIAGEKMAQVL
ncbi:MAG: helix-turn-helix transcriptional regulator [Deltaproteobacteria bacterium]|nr:helix-turn-helix transcriptional regulator [Deltaproteobacteria bacterium]